MEISHRIGIIFLLSTVLVGQEITKFVKGQTKCSTKCKSGYLTTSDTCVFNYEISFKEAMPDTSSLILEIQEADSQVFNPLITLHVMTDCNGFNKDVDFYCTEIDSNTFRITINANELSRYNQSKFRAYTVNVNQNNFYSDIFVFPQIFDPLNSTGHLKINGRNMSTDSCNTTIEVSMLTLEFDCVSAAKPCIVEMQINDVTVIKERENQAFFKGNYDEDNDITVMVKYSACSLDGKFNTISCSVGLIQHTTNDNNDNGVVIGVTVPLACILVLVTIAFLIYRFVTKRRNTDEPMDLTMKETFLNNVSNEKAFEQMQNINEKNKEGNTALMLASANGSLEIVTKLITRGANVNQKNNDGWTALMLATVDNHRHIVTYLVENGAEDTTEEKNGWNALMIATYKGYADIVDMITKQTCKVDVNEMIKNRDFKSVSKTVRMSHCRLEMEKGTLASCPSYVNIYKLGETKANPIQDYMEVQCTDVSGKGKTHKKALQSLWVASKKGRFNLVEKLLNEGVKVDKRDKKGRTALMIATRYGHADIVDLLIQHGADVGIRDKTHSTALIIASSYGHYEIMNKLIEHKADVNEIDVNGWTALMIGCHNGKRDICELLMANQADVKIIDRSGETALTTASRNGHTEIVKLLISKGVDVNAKRNDGWSALMLGCASGHNETAKELIDNKADVNAREHKGLSSLMVASFYGHIDTVKLLIDHGADVNRKSNKGFTALMIASENKHKQIVEMIIETKPTD